MFNFIVSFLVIECSGVFVGMVATACRTLLESLDRLPNEDNRTKVAIIAFDVASYFFSMPVCAKRTCAWVDCIVKVSSFRGLGRRSRL